MPKKHIIIISTMCIIGIGFLIMTFLLSKRISTQINENTTKKEVKNATEKIYASQNRSLSNKLTKDPASGKAETNANDIKVSSDISEGSSITVDENQNNLLSDSLTSQVGLRNDDVSQAEKNATIYAKLKEPFEQLHNLYAQSDSIREDLSAYWNLAKSGREGEIDRYEHSKKLDENVAIDKQILAIYNELKEIIPSAIEIREVERSNMAPYPGYLVGYGVIISREKLEASLGKVPKDMEAFFPKAFRSIRITNFSFYEESKKLDSGSYKMMRTHSKKYMNFDIAKKAIDYYLLHSADSREKVGINVGFYGGEPLLNFDLIKDCVEYVKAHKIGSENVTHNMTTNGTLLNDEIIDFLIANNFHLLVSLDGPKSKHDKYRVFPNGMGSFDIIIKNLKKIQRRNPDYYRFNVSFSVVIAPPVDYIEVDKFFSDSEVIGEHYSITSTPVTPGAEFLRQFDHEELTNVQGNEKLWRKYTDGLLQRTSRDPLYLWEYAVARSMFEPNLLPIYDCPPYDRLANNHYAGGICIPGHRKLFVSAEGLFYVCERVSATGNEKDLYCIGNVETGIDYNKVFKLIDEFCSIAELDCCRCWAARLCTVCFSPIVPGDDQRITANEKRKACQSARELVHNFLIKFYTVIESDPKAFDFMENIERMRY